jgi:hypothetical protein
MSASLSEVKQRLRDEVIEEFAETHVVLTEDELRLLLQRVAEHFLTEGYDIARNVLQATIDGGSERNRNALRCLDYAATEGGIVEVATDQAKDTVAMFPLRRKDAQ